VAEWQITSFYKFTNVEDPDRERAAIQRVMGELDMLGLVVLAPEGINATAARLGPLDEFKQFILGEFGHVRFKDSIAEVQPFKRLSIDVRAEIVGMKRPETRPSEADDHHLSASEWHDRLSSNAVVIDTRNAYETRAGKFRNAIDPGLQHFSEWPSYLDRAGLSTDDEILIYCTGGIRCEKAILAMRERGFSKVYQLRDGILGYLAEFPQGGFEGECFVFDDRVTVGPDLLPTGNYGICPGCGLPSSEKRSCVNCDRTYFVCEACSDAWAVCSKTCRSQVEARSRGK
jgi:UPF0176 protein